MDVSSSSDDIDDEVTAFDTYDTQLYLFDNMDRKAAEDLLRVADVGTFLLRRSASKPGSYCLSVKVSLEDDNSIRHFIIEQKMQSDSNQLVYHMNGADYRDLPTLITHFTINPLGSSKYSTLLRRPAPKAVLEMVKSTHRFFGERATDLPFALGEKLDVLEKPEEDWWIARNALGGVGFVPSNYLERLSPHFLDANIHKSTKPIGCVSIECQQECKRSECVQASNSAIDESINVVNEAPT